MSFLATWAIAAWIVAVLIVIGRFAWQAWWSQTTTTSTLVAGWIEVEVVRDRKGRIISVDGERCSA